jgi:DNA-binding NtrC family response regulator
MAVTATVDNSILFVDDEKRVLTSMRAMFRRDYNVLLANSGTEALEILRNQPVDVVVSDQRMPGMTGVEVLKQVKTLAPKAMRILLTGYADLNAIEASINDAEVFRYLMKPCPSDELKEAIALAATVAKGSPVGSMAAAETSALVPPPAPAADIPSAEEIELFDVGVAPAPANRGARVVDFVASAKGAHSHPPARVADAAVELLALSTDRNMVDALADAMHGVRRVHHAETIEEAVALLEIQPIGVLVTDTAVSEKDVAGLTASLKQYVPELVTIIASERSDAQMLIRMINYGQIFRFLLKPIQVGQTRLWIDSAVNKHLELARNPDLVERHRVRLAESPGSLQSLFSGLRDKVRRLRGRLLPTGWMD